MYCLTELLVFMVALYTKFSLKGACFFIPTFALFVGVYAVEEVSIFFMAFMIWDVLFKQV